MPNEDIIEDVLDKYINEYNDSEEAYIKFIIANCEGERKIKNQKYYNAYKITKVEKIAGPLPGKFTDGKNGSVEYKELTEDGFIDIVDNNFDSVLDILNKIKISGDEIKNSIMIIIYKGKYQAFVSTTKPSPNAELCRKGYEIYTFEKRTAETISKYAVDIKRGETPSIVVPPYLSNFLKTKKVEKRQGNEVYDLIMEMANKENNAQAQAQTQAEKSATNNTTTISHQSYSDQLKPFYVVELEESDAATKPQNTLGEASSYDSRLEVKYGSIVKEKKNELIPALNHSDNIVSKISNIANEFNEIVGTLYEKLDSLADSLQTENTPYLLSIENCNELGDTPLNKVITRYEQGLESILSRFMQIWEDSKNLYFSLKRSSVENKEIYLYNLNRVLFYLDPIKEPKFTTNNNNIIKNFIKFMEVISDLKYRQKHFYIWICKFNKYNELYSESDNDYIEEEALKDKKSREFELIREYMEIMRNIKIDKEADNGLKVAINTDEFIKISQAFESDIKIKVKQIKDFITEFNKSITMLFQYLEALNPSKKESPTVVISRSQSAAPSTSASRAVSREPSKDRSKDRVPTDTGSTKKTLEAASEILKKYENPEEPKSSTDIERVRSPSRSLDTSSIPSPDDSPEPSAQSSTFSSPRRGGYKQSKKIRNKSPNVNKSKKNKKR